MRSVVMLFVAVFVGQAPTESDKDFLAKRNWQRAQKAMLELPRDPQLGSSWRLERPGAEFSKGLDFLLKSKEGVLFVEDRMVGWHAEILLGLQEPEKSDKVDKVFAKSNYNVEGARKKINAETLRHWYLAGTLPKYNKVVKLANMPDRMMPIFVSYFEWYKGQGMVMVKDTPRFGKHSVGFIPTLEWLRDNSADDQVVLEALSAIREIKGK